VKPAPRIEEKIEERTDHHERCRGIQLQRRVPAVEIGIRRVRREQRAADDQPARRRSAEHQVRSGARTAGMPVGYPDQIAPLFERELGEPERAAEIESIVDVAPAWRRLSDGVARAEEQQQKGRKDGGPQDRRRRQAL